MRVKTIMSTYLLLVGLMVGASNASAVSSYYNVLTSQYGSNTGCGVCHSGGPGSWRPYGIAFRNASGDVQSRILQAGDQINPNTGNTYAIDIQAGGVLPDDNTGGEEEGLEGCMTSGQLSIPMMLLLAMLGAGLFFRRKV